MRTQSHLHKWFKEPVFFNSFSKNQINTFIIVLISFFSLQNSIAQISINALPYNPGTTNFNGYNPFSVANFSATLPSGWSGSSSGTPTYNGQGNGSLATGGYWAYGSAGDFSLGALRSGTPGNITYTISYVNNTGATITGLQISWDYKQWRYAGGGNTSGWNCTGTGALSTNAILNGKDFAGAANGTNGTVAITGVSAFALTGLTIPNGASFGISWVTTDPSGSDNGIALDNFNLQTLPSSNGNIFAGEYGVHANGQNQSTNTGTVSYMNWDANNLYVGISGANTAEGYVLYLDKDPQVPVDGGSNANGTNIGQNYDGTNFAALPFRADLVLYAKSGYRELRTATGSNTWSAATSPFGTYGESGSVREFSIPWSAIGGMPASFNWFGYNTSGGGFIYNTQPAANPGGALGTSIRYEHYFTVSSTTIGSATAPFSRNSYVFNNTVDENAFGTISVYDFTMNTAGRIISRTGATGQNWSVAGNMLVSNGTVYFGSGGVNGAYGSTTISGDLNISGGTLDMDQTTSPLNLNGNLNLSSGTLQLSGNGFTGGDLVLKGNWVNTGGTFNPNSRKVILNATTGNQSIAKAGGETFDILVIDKTAGAVILSNDISVNQLLTLTNGLINTGSNKVVIANNTAGAVTRTNGYVNGNLQRAISTLPANYDFPVGTSSGYTPAAVNLNSVGGGGNLLVSSSDGVSANYPTSDLSITSRLARSWNITNTGVTAFTASATFSYLGADLVGGATHSSIKPYAYVLPSTYAYPSYASGANSFTANGLTAFGEFGAGDCGGFAAGITNNSGTTVLTCSDASISVTGTGGASYVWSNGLGNNANATITAPGNYGVTVTAANGCTAAASINITQDISAPNAGITNNTGSTLLTCDINSISVTATGGVGYAWDNGLGNSAAASVTLPGIYTVTVTGNNGCTAQQSIIITQNLSAPATPDPVQGITNVCPYVGTGTQLTYTVPQDPFATSYTWIVPPTVTTLVSGQGTNSITVQVNFGFIANPNKQIKVKANSSCGGSAYRIFYMLAQQPSTPAPIIASSTNVCPSIGTNIPITYTIPKVMAATSYLWTAQMGTAIITHTNNPGIDDTTVTVTFTNAFTTSAITVRAVNDCGTSSARSFTITRNNPSIPSLISGPTNACPYLAPNGIAANYSIPVVQHATSYTWTVPSGAISLSGQGGNNISFIYPNSFTSGTVAVTATNGCGTSGLRTQAISRLQPATPGIFDIVQVQSCPDRQYSYTLPSLPANAQSVQWTYPGSATLLSGQGTSSLLLSFPGTAINGTITATSVNNCGSSVARTFSVRLPACPLPFARENFADSKNAVDLSIEALKVNVFPNPSTTDFSLQVLTAGKEEISVRVLDMAGRFYKQITVMPYQRIQLGGELKSGSYMIEVKQAGAMKVIRVMKF